MSKSQSGQTNAGQPAEVPPVREYGTGLGSSNKDKSYTESHPSYGMIQVHRTLGGGRGTTLFGSPIESPTTIRIELFEAVVNRDMARDWYFARKCLASVEMSPAQFAELITNFNTSGVPCTLRSVDSDRRPACPQRHAREEIVDEFKGTLAKLAAELRSAVSTATALLADKSKKTLTVADRETLGAAFALVSRFLTDHGPFIHSQFDEAMDKTVNAAKAEFSAAVHQMAHSLGLSEMAARLSDPTLNGAPAAPLLPVGTTNTGATDGTATGGTATE